MHEITNLLKAVAQHPEDWLRYFVLADAFEEEGKLRQANWCRWLGTNKKRPFSIGGTIRNWYNGAHYAGPNPSDPASDLPASLFHALTNYTVERSNTFWKVYPTFQKALQAVLRVEYPLE